MKHENVYADWVIDAAKNNLLDNGKFFASKRAAVRGFRCTYPHRRLTARWYGRKGLKEKTGVTLKPWGTEAYKGGLCGP